MELLLIILLIIYIIGMALKGGDDV